MRVDMETQMQGALLCDKIWGLDGKDSSISPAESEFLPGFPAQQDKPDHVCDANARLSIWTHFTLIEC